MVNSKDVSRYIGKYAFILIIIYILEFLLILASNQLFANKYYGHMDASFANLWFTYVPIGITIILNLVTAIFVFLDTKNRGIKQLLLMSLTIVWRPLGVCLFLLSLINIKSIVNE